VFLACFVCIMKLFLFVSFCILLVAFCEAEPNTKTFVLKPDKPDTVTLDGCNFRYHVSGGTSENWILSVEKTPSGVLCEVKRSTASKSYLFFREYAVSWDGAAPISRTEVFDSNSKALVRGDSWNIVDNQVVSKKGWMGTIGKIQVFRAAK